MTRKTSKKQIATKLFAVISKSFGPEFAFNAIDQKDAQRKINLWNDHHSFNGSDERTIKEIQPDDMGKDGMWVSLHNEYIEYV